MMVASRHFLVFTLIIDATMGFMYSIFERIGSIGKARLVGI